MVINAVVVYHWEWLRSGSLVASYGYPTWAVGTVCITFGVTLCSYVVQSSTETYAAEPKDPSFREKFVVVRLQAKIDGLHLPAYAIPSSSAHAVVRISLQEGEMRKTAQMRAQQEVQEDGKEDGKEGGEEDMKTIAKEIAKGVEEDGTKDNAKDNTRAVANEVAKGGGKDHEKDDANGERPGDAFGPGASNADGKWLFVSTIAGTFLTLSGFILQNIGVRELHWSAGVLQLGATLILTVLRGVLRGGVGGNPFPDPTPLNDGLGGSLLVSELQGKTCSMITDIYPPKTAGVKPHSFLKEGPPLPASFDPQVLLVSHFEFSQLKPKQPNWIDGVIGDYSNKVCDAIQKILDILHNGKDDFQWKQQMAVGVLYNSASHPAFAYGP